MTEDPTPPRLVICNECEHQFYSRLKEPLCVMCANQGRLSKKKEAAFYNELATKLRKDLTK